MNKDKENQFICFTEISTVLMVITLAALRIIPLLLCIVLCGFNFVATYYILQKYDDGDEL